MNFISVLIEVFLLLIQYHNTVQDATFVRITNVNQRNYLSCETKLHQKIFVTHRFECFKFCSRKTICNFIEYNQLNCSLYESLSFNNSILNGKFWFKKILNSNSIDCIEYPGLTTQYSISTLLSHGFIIAYDGYYSTGPSYTYLQNLLSQCSSLSILCAGGGANGSDILDLIACANCQIVLTPTALNIPVFAGSAYWYLTDGKSFGFAPNSSISQYSADTFNTNDPLRLSWHMSGGGWRLGSKIGLSTTLYKKYLFIRN